MKCLWDDGEATQHAGDLTQRVYTSRLLGRERSLVLQCGGGTSVKIKEKNVFGEKEDILYVSGADRDLESIEAEGFLPMRLNYVTRLAKLDSLSDTQLANEIKSTIVSIICENLCLCSFDY